MYTALLDMLHWHVPVHHLSLLALDRSRRAEHQGGALVLQFAVQHIYRCASIAADNLYSDILGSFNSAFHDEVCYWR